MFEILFPWLHQQRLQKLKEQQLLDHVKMLLFLTHKYLGDHPNEVERLWIAVAQGTPSNTERILHALIMIGRQKHNAQYLLQAKRACVYLGRAEPDAAVRALVKFEPAMASVPSSSRLPPSQFAESMSDSSLTPIVYQKSVISGSSAGGADVGVIEQAQRSTKIESDFQQLMENLEAPTSHTVRKSSRPLGWDESTPTRLASGSRLSSAADPALTTARSGDGSESSDSSVDMSLALLPEMMRRGDSHPFDEIVPSLSSEWDLTVEQFRLVFLTQLSYEISQEFRVHLPVILHFIILQLDHPQLLVYEHCRLMLTNLLELLVVQPLQSARTKHNLDPQQQAAFIEGQNILAYLQGKIGQQFWANEDTSLKLMQPQSSVELSHLVQSLRIAFDEERSLPVEWAVVALRWATTTGSSHVACRSYQVFRALHPTLSKSAVSESLDALLRALVSSRSQPLHLGVVTELLLTLNAAVHEMNAQKLLLYPQLFWGAIAMLHTDFEQHYNLALSIVTHISCALDFRDPYVQNVFEASVPRGICSHYSHLFLMRYRMALGTHLLCGTATLGCARPLFPPHGRRRARPPSTAFCASSPQFLWHLVPLPQEKRH